MSQEEHLGLARFSRAIDKLAGAVELKSDVQDVKREVAILTEAVRGQLSKQDVINNRLEETTRELVRQGANTKERLVAVEQVCARFPLLEAQVGNLRTQVAKYVGMGVALSLVLNPLFSWALSHWGGK
ncbi:MAG: hypothetical protein KKC30_15720 [Proteobacteria bacterium]|nr:hypothetical protein [Pseudomonadota bacterium]MBU4381581.1 hypothetical protein [Pseudomonadota bacterium]MCG2766567.1 hypothetical protein [Desulfarculaceae bacterium]